jgi:allantoinase
MDWTCDDQPIWMKTRNGRILAMLYPIETNDNRAIVWFRYTSSELADMLIDNFDEMLEQSARQPLLRRISLHPFVMGLLYHIRQLRRVFQYILLHREHIWLTWPRDICAHIETCRHGSCP